MASSEQDHCALELPRLNKSLLLLIKSEPQQEDWYPFKQEHRSRCAALLYCARMGAMHEVPATVQGALVDHRPIINNAVISTPVALIRVYCCLQSKYPHTSVLAGWLSL